MIVRYQHYYTYLSVTLFNTKSFNFTQQTFIFKILIVCLTHNSVILYKPIVFRSVRPELSKRAR